MTGLHSGRGVVHKKCRKSCLEQEIRWVQVQVKLVGCSCQ